MQVGGVVGSPARSSAAGRLALRPGQVLTRHDLVPGQDTTWVGDERIVVHIANLRRKLGTGTRGRGFIDTVRGVGYRVGQP